MATLSVRFYRSATGHEPVREWLLSLDRELRRSIGSDIKTVEIGWPLGMPLVRKMAPKLWEVRTPTNVGAARVLFTVLGEQLVLLHGFIKKSQKTPQQELELALRRLKEVHDEQ